MAKASSGSSGCFPLGFVLGRARSQETAPAFRQESGIMNSRSSGRRPQVALWIGPGQVSPPSPARDSVGPRAGGGSWQLPTSESVGPCQ